MRNTLGLCAVLAVHFATGEEITNRSTSEDGRPPRFPIPHRSEYDSRGWPHAPTRPPGSRSFNVSPLESTPTCPILVSGQVLPPVTVKQSGVASTATIYMTSTVTRTEVYTHSLPLPAGTTITVDQTLSVPYTVYKEHTTTEFTLPACYLSGATSTPDAAICNGKDCDITFEKGAFIHWELLTNRTPLVTHYIHSTCMAVSCNTTEFSLYYSRTATSCGRPPCPSNSLNCECNIVVGPIRLPDGRITSVTQTGPSGWNLNLGPAATINNIARCGSNGLECGALATTLFTPLIYTDNVKVLSTSAYRNDSQAAAEATAFLLSQLTDYFPSQDPLGMCTNVKLSLPLTTTTRIGKRDDVATVGGDGITTWPGCETLTDTDAKKRGLGGRQQQSIVSDTTQLPICSSEATQSTTAVTVTPGPSTPIETQARSGARDRGGKDAWVLWWVGGVVMMVGHVGLS